MDWLDVTKELPDKNKDINILCYCEVKDILNDETHYIFSVGTYANGYQDNWSIQSKLNFMRYKVVAWMPLPDPPAFA
jgi:hypothetical protein